MNLNATTDTAYVVVVAAETTSAAKPYTIATNNKEA